MRAAAAAERDRVERELQRLKLRKRELAAELLRTEQAHEQLSHELHILGRFSEAATVHASESADSEPRLRVVTTTRAAENGARDILLRGAGIRETAVRVLAATPQAEDAVHYRTWFELLRQHRFLPAGKDPLATFLTQIGRSPVVQRSTASGTYSLILDYPALAERRLDQLEQALQQANDLPADVDVTGIAAARERRTAITSEIEATQRSLDEALRSLGKPDNPAVSA